MMASYSYEKAVRADVHEWLDNELVCNEEYKKLLEDAVSGDSDGSALYERCEDDMWVADSVTGNASGSYTCNRNKAKQYVLGDIDTVLDVLSQNDRDEDIGRMFTHYEWELIDVGVRCYLLGSAITYELRDRGVAI